MSHQDGYFEYPTPHLYQLRNIYKTPYRFSKDLTDYIDTMYLHPKYSPSNQLYHNLRVDWSANDMAKPAYLLIKYAIDNINQFGGSLENIIDHIVVAMWKNFLGNNKKYRGAKYIKYYPTKMRILVLGKGKFLDLMVDEIEQNKMIMDGDDMVIKREGVSLRGRRNIGYNERYMKYLCGFD